MTAFLLDQGLPRTAADRLRDAGHDAVHVAELGLSEADDEDILARARAEGRVVVTLDVDFHTLLVLSGASQPSVIRIRDEKLRGDDVARVVAQVLASVKDELGAGAAITVRSGFVRWRRLPI